MEEDIPLGQPEPYYGTNLYLQMPPQSEAQLLQINFGILRPKHFINHQPSKLNQPTLDNAKLGWDR